MRARVFRTIPAVLVLLSFPVVSLAGPEENQRNNTIGYNPAGITDALLNLTYERAIADNMSVSVTSGLWYKKGQDSSEFNNVWIAGMNCFLLGRAPAGLFIGPRLMGVYSQEKRSSDYGEDEHWYIWAVGGALGYHWIWDSGFSLGLAAGSLYLDYLLERTSRTAPHDYPEKERWNGTFPYGEFFVGYSF